MPIPTVSAMSTATTSTSVPSTLMKMVGSTKINDDNIVLPTLDDIPEENKAEIEAKTRELHALMLGRYTKTHTGFIKRNPNFPDISMDKVTLTPPLSTLDIE
ncbi:hypothetical protein GUJ93_ZPchr0015g6768 [Zizania palustris]|uniref:Uncharacterized protein n=1 Tax=Zizania palustris TaxID=103762 RepID=A0A8J5TD78_ZIZPA|nr:hypothetical protein GUJ93_ZPchr0015g6768 [Zizania palustris]